MKAAPTELERMQRWMQAVVTHPGGVGAGVSSEDARRSIDVAFGDLETVVNRSRSLTGAERLAIYGRAYYARLLECFRAEFPCLLHALGDELFNQFVSEYLRRHPPRGYTLNRLAENFPRFLAETRPDADAPRGRRESWPDFVVDLATLERAFGETFDGPGLEGETVLRPRQVLGVPAARFQEMRLAPAPCLRVLAFSYPVAAYFHAARRGRKPELPAPAETFLALTRRNYTVRFFDLSAAQYEFLRALLNDSTVARASLQAAGAAGRDRAALEAEARAWLRDWAAAGFFRQLLSPDEP